MFLFIVNAETDMDHYSSRSALFKQPLLSIDGGAAEDLRGVGTTAAVRTPRRRPMGSRTCIRAPITCPFIPRSRGHVICGWWQDGVQVGGDEKNSFMSRGIITEFLFFFLFFFLLLSSSFSRGVEKWQGQG